jgi:hypothetical protein
MSLPTGIAAEADDVRDPRFDQIGAGITRLFRSKWIVSPANGHSAGGPGTRIAIAGAIQFGMP